MIYLFPLMTIFWGGLFPSGLILYWIVYTAFLVVQQYTIMGWGNLFPIFGWSAALGAAERCRATASRSRRVHQPTRTMGRRMTGSPPPTAPPAPALPATTASASAKGRDDDEAVDDDLQGIHR